MNVKHIFLTLIVLFTINSLAISQVKKQYRDNINKSTTVVIKEDGANDFDILNSQFNLDDYAVNEQIKITTDQALPSAPAPSNNVSGGKAILPPAPDLSTATTSVSYERPKTKMKRWSVRKKSEPKTTKVISVVISEEEPIIDEVPATITTKPSRTKSTGNAKKASSRKYRKKSKKAKKKKRVRKLKNRKRKTRRNKKGACYKF